MTSKYKEEAKRNHDKRHQSKEYKLKTGDAVIVKREKKKKGETPYEQYIYMIKIKGTMVTAKRMKDGKTKCRDISRFKRLKMYKYPEEEQWQNQETLVPPVKTYLIWTRFVIGFLRQQWSVFMIRSLETTFL